MVYLLSTQQPPLGYYLGGATAQQIEPLTA